MEAYRLHTGDFAGHLKEFFDLPALLTDNNDRFLLETKELRRYLTLPSDKKVLVVEDDPTQAAIMEDLIQEINPDSRVDWEADVAGAIQRIENARLGGDERGYDLIISDIVLKGDSSGLDILEYTATHCPHTRTVLMSAYDREQLKQRYIKKIRPINYLSKPIDFLQFKKQVGPVLGSPA